MKNHPPKPGQEILEPFQHHLRDVVGLAAKTCQDRLRDVSGFLEAASVLRIADLAKVAPTDLVSYVSIRSADYVPASLRLVAGSLRQFFRFVQQEGWIKADLSLAVPRIASHAPTALPAYLSQQQLESLLASWDPDTVPGRRDFAIGMCLAKLGMRAGEVAALALEDLDWRQGCLRLRRCKNGSQSQLPLLSEVGAAIADYLRNGRGSCNYREVFLSQRLGRPMSSWAISQVIRRALHACGIQVPRPGAHLLRHTLASHLVQNGASLKDTADVLRHRDLNSTSVYAHLDVVHLRSVARAFPKGAIL